MALPVSRSDSMCFIGVDASPDASPKSGLKYSPKAIDIVAGIKRKIQRNVFVMPFQAAWIARTILLCRFAGQLQPDHILDNRLEARPAGPFVGFVVKPEFLGVASHA